MKETPPPPPAVAAKPLPVITASVTVVATHALQLTPPLPFSLTVTFSSVSWVNPRRSWRRLGPCCQRWSNP